MLETGSRPPHHRIVAAILVVLIPVAGCSSGDAAEPTASSPAAETTATSTLSTTTSTAAPGALTPEVATAAFLQWSTALAAVDTQRAWELMAVSSQRSLGTYERFASWGSGLAEGWGAWSEAADIDVAIQVDAAGRLMATFTGTVTREGMTERAESAVFFVAGPTGPQISPFEEFGNVAAGLADEGAAPPIPDGSGSGRRIVYANTAQRVWIVEADGTVVDTYLVSGREGVPAPGQYEVFSKSELAFAGHDDITMQYMVRFTKSPTSDLAIGFHSIPNRGDGTPMQTEEELGEYHSAGCVRQSLGHAAALYEWADVGTVVIVLP
jgi:hypothetical protein